MTRMKLLFPLFLSYYGRFKRNLRDSHDEIRKDRSAKDRESAHGQNLVNKINTRRYAEIVARETPV